ncbi:MAG: hypothetical protein IT326_00910, partial [Anaerolineae bacterium]|nr:hypothetical protein [Anaerolineae bacterium]
MEPQREKKPSQDANWVGGIVLIVLGGLFLVNQFFPLNEAIWSVVMAAVGVAFLGAYLMNRQNWGFLIPAYVFFAIAALIF